MSNSAAWAAGILSCSEAEAFERIKIASAQLEQKERKKGLRGIDPLKWPEFIENGGSMARLRAAANSDDPNIASEARKTVAEIEECFWQYAKEKDTQKYGLKLLCLTCGGLQLVAKREPIDEPIPNHLGHLARKDHIFTLECGHTRRKDATRTKYATA